MEPRYGRWSNAMKILRLDMRTGNSSYEDADETYPMLGGRGLIAALLLKEIDPACDPLGDDNKLVICNGLMAGTLAATSGRLSLGGKSPLTGTIKEANAGGTAGLAMAKLGLRALVVSGSADGMRVLVVGQDHVRLDDAEGLAMQGTYRTCELLRSRYGEGISIVCIGPAGERRYPNSSVQVTDREGHPSRAAARGGLGAVMGRRGLKTVVFLEGNQRPAMKDAARFRAASKAYMKALREHPMTGSVLPRFGTASLVTVINEMGAMPTRNYRTGRFEGADGLSGERMQALQQARGGQMTHACQVGCPIACSNVYHGPDGEYLTSGMEYETIALNGSNLDVADLDTVAAVDRLCDDTGLDTMETGATIAMAMEAGLLPYGDSAGILDMIRQMRDGTVLGRELAEGTERFGKRYGVRRIPVVKRQALAGYDPRALKGTGVTCATSPMGGDHTAGNTIGMPGLDPLGTAGQVEASRAAQTLMAVFDSLGMCIFSAMPSEDAAVFGLVGEMLAGVYGGSWTPDDVLALGRQTLGTKSASMPARILTPPRTMSRPSCGKKPCRRMTACSTSRGNSWHRRSISARDSGGSRMQARFGSRTADLVCMGGIAFCALVLLCSESVMEAYTSMTAGHPFFMGFCKFALLATLGECLALRLTKGVYSCPVRGCPGSDPGAAAGPVVLKADGGRIAHAGSPKDGPGRSPSLWQERAPFVRYPHPCMGTGERPAGCTKKPAGVFSGGLFIVFCRHGALARGGLSPCSPGGAAKA